MQARYFCHMSVIAIATAASAKLDLVKTFTNAKNLKTKCSNNHKIVIYVKLITNDLLTISMIKKNVHELGEDLINFKKNISNDLVSYSNAMSSVNPEKIKNANCRAEEIKSTISSTAKLMNKLVNTEIMRLIQMEIASDQMNTEELGELLGRISTNGTDREKLQSEVSRFRNLAAETIKSIKKEVRDCAKGQ